MIQLIGGSVRFLASLAAVPIRLVFRCEYMREKMSATQGMRPDTCRVSRLVQVNIAASEHCLTPHVYHSLYRLKVSDIVHDM